MNVQVRLEYELGYFKVAVQHLSHYATGIGPSVFLIRIVWSVIIIIIIIIIENRTLLLLCVC